MAFKKAKRPSPDTLVSRGLPRLPNELRWDVANFNELTVSEIRRELRRCRINIPVRRRANNTRIKDLKQDLVRLLEEHYNNLDPAREVYITPLLVYLIANRRSQRRLPATDGLALRRLIERDGLFSDRDLTTIQESFDASKGSNDCDSWYEFIEGLFDMAQNECEGWEKKYVLISNNPGTYWERNTSRRAGLKPNIGTLERMWSTYRGTMTGFLGPGGTRNREFRQHDAGGNGECLWRAFAHAYWGNADLWQRVQYDAAVVLNYGRRGRGNGHVENFDRDYKRANSVSQRRRELYDDLVEESGDLEDQIFGNEWGTEHALQLIADAYGVQIFAHVPTHDTNSESMTWGVQINGDNDPPRGQIHLINWSQYQHWTALMPLRPDETAGRAEHYPDACSFAVLHVHASIEPLERVPPGHQDRVLAARGAPVDIAFSTRTPADSEANYRIRAPNVQGANQGLPRKSTKGSKRPNDGDPPGPSSSSKKQKAT
ncbi:uncharacterized protein BDZ99DRAFT_521811 [Mytilinidion resinicola]|uniref:OTU domain-containing protein n=1 Tax=Mytilinidion resinicola TaxID=574789 RepID=A0A6A6YHF3_9PEZI|nr:uncharacterized protein BDZ99DRAFT_521811 [Mytilinidion resinicola]KAF2808246.1 hypothetical protein BDZ99DRAFT_521811 [Mytilinidion resinicola]